MSKKGSGAGPVDSAKQIDKAKAAAKRRRMQAKGYSSTILNRAALGQKTLMGE